MIVNGKHYTSIWRNKKKQVFIIDQRILPHEFKIVELKNIEGRSHKEIADYLDISVTAAKVRLHRAHQKLRNILEEIEA